MRRIVIGSVVSAALVLLLLYSVDLRSLSQNLRHVNPALLALAVGLYFVGVAVRSARWQLLLRPVAVVPLPRLFGVMIVGFTVNNLLPARVGELARAYLLARSHGVRAGSTIGSIVVERVLDGLVLCAFILAGWLSLPLNEGPRLLAWLIAGGFVAGTVALWVAARPPRIVGWLALWALGLLPARVAGRAAGVWASFADGLAIMRHGPLFAASLALSVLAWCIEGSMYYVIALAFPLQVGPLAALLALGAANLGTMIPAAPGFIGTFDAPLVGVLTGLFGVNREAAIGYTLVVHAALLVPVVVVGLLLIWNEGLTLRTVARGTAGIESGVAGRDPAAARALD
jgi:uncharacterized protein (TIRG00374 family)